jgi:hypothetical protein
MKMNPRCCDKSIHGWKSVIAVSLAVIAVLAVAVSASGQSLPCDIYASGGTPCVAAHSTVRALFHNYNGRLYQIQRASDGATTDIDTLTTGGYANAATQNSFCAGTTCIITIIYDQSSFDNNLTIEGPGGAVASADIGAAANALPIVAGGHEVYGVEVSAGVGYRDNATSGVATGGSPEGVYMVASGTHTNTGCCFDYGNAEANSHDNGNGHMNAVNFGTTGPWAGADLENGIYGWSSSTTPQTSDFVTATLKNNGQTTFAVKSGNAQSGGLNTQYNGALPCCGYTPMSLEGGIVLGTGGDNSNWSIGSFFEGAMTSGYPSDATENAVQANVVAAGYSGNSNGLPQYLFTSPAIEQPNDLMGTQPALASFNGNLYVAFQANDSSHTFFVTSSSDGTNLPTATGYSNIHIGSAPALAVYDGNLYAAFQANDSSHALFVTSSSNGTDWPTAWPISNVLIGSAPAMAVFNGELYVAFRANDSSNDLWIASSSNGTSFSSQVISGQSVGGNSSPAMAVFNGDLYIAYRANDSSNDLWIASSSNGSSFSSQLISDQSMGGSSSPALVVYNNTLYYIYEANDSSNSMYVTSSTDGSTWSNLAHYPGIQMGATGPGATVFDNAVYVGFQSDDSRNVLFITNN